MAAQAKNLSIETLRGFAIMLVVAGHVIGSAPDGGMKIDFPSAWRYLYIWIDYIQMPLFTAIAGWVYALKPTDGINTGIFISDKVKRLLVPMATVSTLYFLTQYIVPGTNSKEALGEIWKIYLFPYTIFWYLQSLFLIFLAVLVADRKGTMNSVRGWCWTLVAAWLLYILQITAIPGGTPNFFSFEGAMNQLPYFIAGIGIKRYGAQLYPKFKIAFIALALIGIALLQLKWFAPQFYPEIYKSLLPLWAVPSIIIAFNLTKPARFFVFLGTYAYSIYLFHGFGTSGGRIVLSSLGIHNEIIVFLFAFAIALFVPIVADKILSHSKPLRALMLGKPYNQTKR